MSKSFNVQNFANSMINNCHNVQVKEFQKNEIITTYIVNRNMLCIMLEGHADLIRYDFNANQMVVEKINTNDVFGEIFYRININNELFVKANKKCKVLMFNYDIYEKKCKKNCIYHEELLINIPNLVLTKVSELNLRIELLSKKSIRDKILSYFKILSEKNFNKTFELPFSLTNLADYLGVDRCALMRELKFLKEDKIIKKISKNKFTLLNK